MYEISDNFYSVLTIFHNGRIVAASGEQPSMRQLCVFYEYNKTTKNENLPQYVTKNHTPHRLDFVRLSAGDNEWRVKLKYNHKTVYEMKLSHVPYQLEYLRKENSNLVNRLTNEEYYINDEYKNEQCAPIDEQYISEEYANLFHDFICLDEVPVEKFDCIIVYNGYRKFDKNGEKKFAPFGDKNYLDTHNFLGFYKIEKELREASDKSKENLKIMQIVDNYNEVLQWLLTHIDFVKKEKYNFKM
ncbi:hypothetical protein Gyru_ORF102 [Gynaephora ruoergensis nucleopolyhedrovirus]|nr:hypothetical protein Gyru_ORF102 [Gynaephora ruoergensis nucleopolyhedrovirus]